ncbi:uncharacterized protein PRCAT00004631001 [Priceomyces carsonii]|uniref:uncharacterized protein n=1 Tax=Priceomyces carsonii TaxID=28549 RepID=UPI002ED8294C|nr:unnamed protein product [Priceomyces carsonii]
MYGKDDVERIQRLADDWLSIDMNAKSKEEIQKLLQQHDYETLDKKMSKRIAFGTAGLRGSMCSGFANMNDVTILQASQGLVSYLENSNRGSQLSIVIGYDHRYHSQRFAEITASVAITKGFKVFYLGSIDVLSDESLQHGTSESNFDLCVHTPLVPFAIDYFKASAGVMVTASHNPAQDNGFKVYYSNGCQIIPPYDTDIAIAIDENLLPWYDLNVWDVEDNFAKGIKRNLLQAVKEETTEAYLQHVNKNLIISDSINFKFIYTPMQGIGLDIFEKAFKLFKGGSYKAVKEQASPDPAFSTVAFPNPEEKGALNLSIKTADSFGYNLVLANDPDADRFSIAVKTDHKWRQLTGNEIGFLFAMYVIECFPKSELLKVYLLNSTVSSQVLASIAEVEGCNYQDTLTGFKWIGNKAIDLKKEGYLVPFAYEEAIGFMFDGVNDKDGIAAAVIFLQLYQKWCINDNIDLIKRLHIGYEKYGWFKECNGYYKLKDKSRTDVIFNFIRLSYDKQLPETIGNFKVSEWRDLTIGYDTTTSDHIPVLPIDPHSQMITAKLLDSNMDQVRFTCRGSGTEPKLKVYVEGKAESEEAALKIARECWTTLRDLWFKPKENGLTEVV